MDFSRLRNGEWIAAAGGLGLLAVLFLDWFSLGGGSVTDLPNIDGLPSGGSFELDTGVSGWDSLQTIDGFLVVLAGFSGVALGGLAAAGKRLNLPIPRGAVTADLGALSVLIIIWKVMGPGGTEIGLWLGLVASAAIAYGGYTAMREGGYEPLVSVPERRGGTTARGIAASAKPKSGSAPAKAKASAGRSTATKATTARKSSGSAAAKRKTTTTKRATTTRAKGTTKKK